MSDPTPAHAPPAAMTPALERIFAFAVGVIVANVYYAQPIIELIAPSLGLSAQAASFIVSLTQVGYAIGLFLLVPLGDILENRRLILVTVIFTALSLAAAATAQSPSVFLLASLLVGLTSVSVQMLVPLAAGLAPDASRGRVVGNVMGGLLLGILLSRPLSSLVADHFGWRVVFGGAAVAMFAVALVVATCIPRRQPQGALRYGQLIASLVTLFKSTPLLRRRCFYQGNLFAAFTLFWTAVPIELARHHGFSQSQIALFALFGAVGVFSGPLGGRLADAGKGRAGTLTALWCATAFAALTLTSLGQTVVGLALVAVAIDFSVQLSMVIGQRTIYTLPAESRNRLTALYMTCIFIGGSVGSAIASSLFAYGGWPAVGAVTGLFPLMAALAALVWERKPVPGLPQAF